MAEPYVAQLTALVEDAGVASLPADLECRHCFAGAALYSDGKICASWSPVGLAVKLPPDSREAMLADGRGRPLRYFPGGKIKKEYVILSEEVAAESVAVHQLLEASIRYVAAKGA
ncbi:MAG TPA: hypothetical protein EYQ27_19500 [Gemmatimonadetes bacterium]|jgi:TfoX/Sxy family transcriptional regulator of competence genes|nr:hypothetical protein [Gemmatimonadota bacterium]